jgi:predicted amidohydrolase
MLEIALLQLSSCGRDREANLRKGEESCRLAASRGAHVALFPEMWSVGYQGFDPKRAGERETWLELAEPRSGPFVEHFRRLAAELGMAIGITYLEAWPHAPRNTLTLFDQRGAEVLSYAKVHLCPWNPPDNVCTAGEGFPVATLETAAGSVRVGAMICFDREFPESARMLMLDGAELILTPNACDLDDRKSGVGDVRIAQFRARAFENLVAVAMTNYAAPQNDGRSVAFYPDGSQIVQADGAESVVLARVDLDWLREWRAREGSRDDPRSPEKYAAISSPQHPRPLARQDD